MLFPDPSLISSSSSSSSGNGKPNDNHNYHLSTSTVIPPPRFVDLSPFDTKEAEEAVGASIGAPSSATSGQEGGMSFPEGPIVVRPPHPSDYSPETMKSMENVDFVVEDSSSSGNDDDDNNEGRTKPNAGEQRPAGGSYPLLQPVQSPKMHNPSQVPTARPPKPHPFDMEMPMSNEDGRVSLPSTINQHQPQHGHQPTLNGNDLVIDEEEEVEVHPAEPSPELTYDHCHPMYAKRLNWNWTAAGRVANQSCPDGAIGIARWSCNMDNGVPTWNPPLPDMSNCSSPWVVHLLSRIHSHRDSVLSLAEELAKGAKGKIPFSGDLIRAADIIKQLVIRLETLLEETKDDDQQERRAHLIKELLNVSFFSLIN